MFKKWHTTTMSIRGKDLKTKQNNAEIARLILEHCPLYSFTTVSNYTNSYQYITLYVHYKCSFFKKFTIRSFLKRQVERFNRDGLNVSILSHK